MHPEACKELPWDSQFFGIRIAQYSGAQLTEESATAALEFCRERHIDCLYLLLADDPAANSIAESRGFRQVDTRLTLDRALADSMAWGEAPHIRAAEASDLTALREIARASHRDTRFYFDPNFERNRCDALYETWIERSSEGWANRTLVAVSEGRPSGYITCHLKDGAGLIGLFAVAEAARGRGLGKELIAAALEYFRSSAMPSAQVVTQLRNIPAQRIYQSCGFAPRCRQPWFHAWPQKDSGKGNG